MADVDDSVDRVGYVDDYGYGIESVHVHAVVYHDLNFELVYLMNYDSTTFMSTHQPHIYFI